MALIIVLALWIAGVAVYVLESGKPKGKDWIGFLLVFVSSTLLTIIIDQADKVSSVAYKYTLNGVTVQSGFQGVTSNFAIWLVLTAVMNGIAMVISNLFGGSKTAKNQKSNTGSAFGKFIAVILIIAGVGDVLYSVYMMCGGIFTSEAFYTRNLIFLGIGVAALVLGICLIVFRKKRQSGKTTDQK